MSHPHILSILWHMAQGFLVPCSDVKLCRSVSDDLNRWYDMTWYQEGWGLGLMVGHTRNLYPGDQSLHSIWNKISPVLSEHVVVVPGCKSHPDLCIKIKSTLKERLGAWGVNGKGYLACLYKMLYDKLSVWEPGMRTHSKKSVYTNGVYCLFGHKVIWCSTNHVESTMNKTLTLNLFT